VVTKKRKTTSKVAEAAREYSPRSRKPKPGALGEALWDMLSKLSEEEQSAFAQKMMNDPVWYEDIYDTIEMDKASKEPGRPLEDYIAEVERERRKSNTLSSSSQQLRSK
jgi:hypothetical protein